MIYQKTTKRTSAKHDYIQLQAERSKGWLRGSGDDNFVRLKDELGNVWSGTAERGADNIVYYHLRDASGRYMSGVATNFTRMLRDGKNRTWKGIVE
jgi:hypothetical protein